MMELRLVVSVVSLQAKLAENLCVFVKQAGSWIDMGSHYLWLTEWSDDETWQESANEVHCLQGKVAPNHGAQ